MNKKIIYLIFAFLLLGACAVQPPPKGVKKLKPESPKPSVKKSLVPEAVKKLLKLCKKSVIATATPFIPPVTSSSAADFVSTPASAPASASAPAKVWTPEGNKKVSHPPSANSSFSVCSQINFKALSVELARLQWVLQKDVGSVQIISHKDISQTLALIKSFYFLVQKAIFKYVDVLDDDQQKHFTQSVFFQLEKKSYNQVLFLINTKNQIFYSQFKNILLALNQALEKTFQTTSYNIDIEPIQKRVLSYRENNKAPGFFAIQTMSQNRKQFERHFQQTALNILTCLEIGTKLKPKTESIKNTIYQKQKNCKQDVPSLQHADTCRQFLKKIIDSTNVLKKELAQIPFDCHNLAWTPNII